MIIAESLSAAIDSVKDGKKLWIAVAQWLTLLAPPVEPIQPKKRVRPTESTPNQSSKRQQLLAKQAIGWNTANASQKAKEQPSRKCTAKKETLVETPVRPLKINLRWPEQPSEQQQEQEPLAALINSGTLAEEQEEEPVEPLLRRKQTRDEGHKGEESSPVRDNIPKPRPEEP
jgi:hypothetical protein